MGGFFALYKANPSSAFSIVHWVLTELILVHKIRSNPRVLMSMAASFLPPSLLHSVCLFLIFSFFFFFSPIPPPSYPLFYSPFLPSYPFFFLPFYFFLSFFALHVQSLHLHSQSLLSVHKGTPGLRRLYIVPGLEHEWLHARLVPNHCAIFLGL